MAASCFWCSSTEHLGIQCSQRRVYPSFTGTATIPTMTAIVTEPAKECKGKGAARCLAVMVLDPLVSSFLTENSPMILEQARKSLEPFGYPDLEALKSKLGL
jgi:hypothetical protein